MGVDPVFRLIMGIDDVQRTRDGELVDPRLRIPNHAPADLVAAYGMEWWRYGGDDLRAPLPSIQRETDWARFDRQVQREIIYNHLLERPNLRVAEDVPGDDRALANAIRNLLPETLPADEVDRAALAEHLLATVEAWRQPRVPIGRPLSQVLHWDSEYTSNVMGFVVDVAGTDLWAWALCVHLGDAYMTSGYARLPSCDLAEDQSVDARLLKRWLWKRLAQTRLVEKDGRTIPAILPNGAGRVTMREGARDRSKRLDERWRTMQARRKRKLIKNGWNVPSLSMQVEGWALTAHYLLRYIGMDVRQADLKPMLCWTWA